MRPSQDVALTAVCDEIAHEFSAGAGHTYVQRFRDGFLVLSDVEETPTAVFGFDDEEGGESCAENGDAA